MKITSEKLEQILYNYLKRSFTIESEKEKSSLGVICRNSRYFDHILSTYFQMFSVENKRLEDIIFNCLMTGIEIGHKIAEDSIEVKQLEVIYNINEEGDN